MKSRKSLFYKYRHIIFLAGLLLTIFFSDITAGILGEYEFIFNMVVMLFASVSLTTTRKSRLLLAIMLVLIIISWVSSPSEEYDVSNLLIFAMLSIYYIYITVLLFRDILNAEQVSGDIILGALSGYILIGIQGTFIFGVLSILNPNTLSTPTVVYSALDEILYFSFISMTTIGYGDVVPTTPLSQKLAVLLGLVGQFYIAIVMAILVGKFLSADNTKE